MVKRLLPFLVIWVIFDADLRMVGFIQTKTTTKPVIKGYSVYSVTGSTRTTTVQGVISGLTSAGANYVVYESSRVRVRKSTEPVAAILKF